MTKLEISAVDIAAEGDGTFHVVGTWSGGDVPLDRANSSGYVVRGRRLAERLAQAMRDGRVFENAEIKTDVNGRTYVSATSTVLGRTVNADLRRMGY